MSSPKKPTYNSAVVSNSTTPDRNKKTKSPDEEPGTDIIHPKTKAKLNFPELPDPRRA